MAPKLYRASEATGLGPEFAARVALVAKPLNPPCGVRGAMTRNDVICDLKVYKPRFSVIGRHEPKP
jgi:hypothetical protein